MSHTLRAPVPIEVDDKLTDIGWAWAITIEKGADSFILVRKNTYGAEVAQGVAEALLNLIKAAEADS